MLYQIHSHTIRITPKNAFDYVAHAHSYYEITYCTRGRYAVSCNFKDTVLEEGDVMIAFSNDVHSYNTSKEGEAILLLFDPEHFSSPSDRFPSPWTDRWDGACSPDTSWKDSPPKCRWKTPKRHPQTE